MDNKKWNELVNRVAKRLYDGKQKGIIDAEMVRQTAAELMQAITVGIGYDFANADTEKKYSALLRLRENVFHFSGAKNYNQLQEMSALLMSGDKKTPFKEFLKGVQTVDKTYTENYLQAEYNHAVSSSQMIAKWNQIEEEAEVFPFLQFDAVNDSRTRTSHAALDGVVRHYKDNFWKTNYPPLDWNCRCTVRQLDEDDAGSKQHKTLPKDLPKVPALFKQNVGTTGIVYSAAHPYFTSIPSDKLKQVVDESGELYRNKVEPKRWDILVLDRAKQFDKFTDTVLINGRYKKVSVQIHRLTDKNSESFPRELKMAQEKAAQGIKVEMLPELKSVEDELFYHKIFPNNQHKPKHPDYRFNQKNFFDLKSPTGKGKSTLDNNIRNAQEQADNAIIELKNQNPPTKTIKNIVRGRMKKHQHIQTVEVIWGNKRKIYERKKLGL